MDQKMKEIAKIDPYIMRFTEQTFDRNTNNIMLNKIAPLHF